MSKSNPLVLSIPEPCSENWDEMTPVAQGRFCAHCQKSVVDFSGWSDTALYRFFEQHKGPVCGRLLHTQLNRPIQLPPQKPTLLYRIALTMGLTLVMTHATTEVKARPRPPLVEYSFLDQDTVTKKDDSLVWVFKGVVLDELNKPFEGVTVIFKEHGITKGGAMTKENGTYVVRIDRASSLKENLDIEFNYAGYERLEVNAAADSAWQKVTMKKSTVKLEFIGLLAPPPRYLDKTDIIKPKRFGY